MSNIDGFKKQIANITTRVHEMRSVLLDPIVAGFAQQRDYRIQSLSQK